MLHFYCSYLYRVGADVLLRLVILIYRTSFATLALLLDNSWAYRSHGVSSSSSGGTCSISTCSRFVVHPSYIVQLKGVMSDNRLGWTWQCNVFGHYIVVRTSTYFIHKCKEGCLVSLGVFDQYIFKSLSGLMRSDPFIARPTAR